MWQNGTVDGRANLRRLQVDQVVHYYYCRLPLIFAHLGGWRGQDGWGQKEGGWLGSCMARWMLMLFELKVPG